MNIFVSGGSGFIGTHLIKKLNQTGHKITIFDNFSNSSKIENMRKHKKNVPLVLKISPDMEDDDLETLCKQMLNYEIDGVIVTNTTIDKNLLIDKSFLSTKGGVSGKPLFKKSNVLIKNIKNLRTDTHTYHLV